MPVAPNALRAVLAETNAAARYRHEPGGEDQWQTPAELIRAGAGDCEDFAIAYWHALRHVAPAPRLACLLLDEQREPHMVCLAGPWVLDVLADEPYTLHDRDDVLCVAYTLGEVDGQPATWVGAARRAQPLAKWADVWHRIHAEEAAP